MPNSKKQEKPNNIKAKEFLPKDDGQPAKGVAKGRADK